MRIGIAAYNWGKQISLS